MTSFAPGMNIDQSIEFSVDHVAIIKGKNISAGRIPSQRAEAGRITFLVPIAVPSRGIARSRSSVPDKRFSVFGRLIIACPKDNACAQERQDAPGKNESKSSIQHLVET